MKNTEDAKSDFMILTIDIWKYRPGTCVEVMEIWKIDLQNKWSSIACVCPQSLSRVWLCNHMDCSLSGSFLHKNSPGKNIGVGSHAPFQAIFPTQGSNPGLLHCRQILYHLSCQGSPWILKWVNYPFSRGSSWPRKWTEVSFIAGAFFTSWVGKEAL